ncbi:MAG TPA: winged helix-turn-helix domain-containing protein, partial [Candidatus Solibacter sp.]|nr:winged helix-turn-helix domain-containing protein [Candidatus Solibacter sp.]
MGGIPEPVRRAYEFGPFSLDVERRLMLKSDQVIPLTSKAFETLLALVQNHSRVVEKEELLKQIWPDTVVEERNLAVNISTLRKVLGESPESHDYIVTIPGRGYRFVAPVREFGSAEKSGDESSEILPLIRRGGGLRQVLLASGIAAALIVVFAIGRYSKVSPARPVLRFSTVTNFAGVEGQPAISPDGRMVSFVSDRGGQFDIWVGLLSGGSLVRITNDANVESRPRWSPDGTKLLYARLNESGLWDSWLVPTLGGSARKLLSNAADPAWSPDGLWIAYANLVTGSIWICDATGREPRALTQPEGRARHRQPAFSPDGRRVAFARRSVSGGPTGELAVSEVDAHKWLSLTDDGAFAGSPAWSPDGRFIYFASGRGGAINIWKVGSRGGQPEQITVGPGDDAELDVSANGQKLVFSSYRININLEEISLDGDPRQGRLAAHKWLTSDAARGELAPAYSPDGRRIAYFTNRRGAEREAIWIMEADGSNPVQLIEDERVNVYPRWARDGQSLIYASRLTGAGASRYWDQLELRRVMLSGGLPQRIPFQVANPMGDVGAREQLLYRRIDGSVAISDASTNQQQTLKDVAGTYLRWCPDGGRFAAVVYPRDENDSSAGVWVHDLEGKRRQVFTGWAAFYTWAGADELLILEGKPDLNGILWRVRLDGSPKMNLGSIRLIY